MSKATSGSKVLINSVIYSCSGLLLKCFSFFLLPLYTVYLTTEDYGVTNIVSSFIATMSFVVTLSLFSAIERFYVEFKEDPNKLKRFYGSVVCFSFLSSIGWGAIFSIFRESLSRYIFSGIDFYPVILICLASLTFNVQHTVYTSILKSQQKAKKSSVLSIIFFFVTLSFNLLFVVGLKMGAVGVLLATLISDGIFFVAFLVDVCREKAIAFCLDGNLLKTTLKYSIPIMPHNLSTRLAVLVSNSLIGTTASLGALGVYSVASQFGNIADTVQTYVNSAYAPWLYEKLHMRENCYKEAIRNIVRPLVSVLGLFMVGIALFSQDYIVLFLEESYKQAWQYVPLVVLVFAIKTIYYFYINVLFYYKKASRLLFTATLTGSLVNIALSYFMIPQWGALGSVFSDAIAMLLRVVIIVVISLHFEDVGLKIRDFVINFFVVAGFILVGLAPSYLQNSDTFSLWNFIYKVIIVLVYVGVVLLTYRKSILGWLNFRKTKRGAK